MPVRARYRAVGARGAEHGHLRAAGARGARPPRPRPGRPARAVPAALAVRVRAVPVRARPPPEPGRAGDEEDAGSGERLADLPRLCAVLGPGLPGARVLGPGVFQFAGDIAWRRQGRGVQRLEANLRRVIGPQATGKQLRALSRAGMRSYARYWMEVFRLPAISQQRIMAGVRSTGGEKAAFAHLAAGRGVVFALPHMGNWETAGAWIIAGGRAPVHHRRRAAQTGIGLPALPRLPGVRWGSRCCPPPAATAGSASWPSGCARAAWSACRPTGMSPAAASRWTSSARRPG